MGKILRGILVYLVFLVLIAGASAVEVTQNVTATILPDYINVTSPLDGQLYLYRMIPMSGIASNKMDSLIYSLDNNLFLNICKNCKTFKKTIPFDDGFHELAFKAFFPSGTAIKNINFTVDTKKPIIRKVSPVKGFAFGNFSIEFEEKNLINITLTYGNNQTGFRKKYLESFSCLEEKNRKKCSTWVDLDDFDQQKISYWFEVVDIAERKTASKSIFLDVDFSAPIIEDVEYDIIKKRVEFKITVDELNFESLKINDTTQKSNWVALCYKLKNGICEAKVPFKSGTHNILIRAVDKAGNSAEKSISFAV